MGDPTTGDTAVGLDYKPHAARENPAKVMRQLGAYARALGYRAGRNPLRVVR